MWSIPTEDNEGVKAPEHRTPGWFGWDLKSCSSPLPWAGTPPLGQVPPGLVQIGFEHLFWAESWQAGGVWVLGVGTTGTMLAPCQQRGAAASSKTGLSGCSEDGPKALHHLRVHGAVGIQSVTTPLRFLCRSLAQCSHVVLWQIWCHPAGYLECAVRFWCFSLEG